MSMPKFTTLLFVISASGFAAGATFAQDSKQTANAVIATPETCKPVCAKAKEADLTDEKEKVIYKDCFVRRLCEAGRIIYPLAKEYPPGPIWELLLGGTKEYKG